MKRSKGVNGSRMAETPHLISPAEQRQMEAELREAEERVALSALDALSAQIAILDDQGTILAVNRAWRDFARRGGCDRGAVGENYFLCCDGEPNPFTKFAEGVQLVLRGRRPEFSMEYRCEVSGAETWFHGKVTRSDKGGPTRVVIAHEDISERVRLEREIVAVSAREQQRFGQELHDGLSQHLTGLKFKASLLEYQLQSKNLPEAADAKALSQLLNEATDEASNLARSVRPVEIEPRGLMMALRELANRTEQAHKVVCQVQFRRPVFIHDGNVATNLYRIAEEAVEHSVAQRKARRVVVSLSEAHGCVTLMVRSDGRALPRRSPRRSELGYHMMQYRARMIGGTIEWRQNISGGTTLMCSFHRPGPGNARTAPQT